MLLATRMAPASALAIAAVWIVSCRSGSTDEAAPVAEPKPKHETGNCQNENVEGTCRFDGIGRLNPKYYSKPDGTSVFRVNHAIEVKGGERTIRVTSLHLRATDDSQRQLVEYYQQHSPSPCSAYIVRPPCNPDATSVKLGFDPPPFAKVE
jgi:hypothetical protein